MFGALLVAVLLTDGPPPISSSDQELTLMAADIVQIQRLPYTVTVEIREEWRQQYIVDAYLWVYKANHLRILMSPLLVEGLDRDGKRALLAHELAHTQFDCGLDEQTWKDKLACEIRTDRQAVRWVGRRTMLKGLCQLIAVSWYWKYRTDVADLIERIKKIHYLPEDPV